MASTSEFWTQMGMSPAPAGALAVPVRFRLDEPLLTEIDRIEAFARGAGYRDVSRSDIIRVALQSFVDGFRTKEPDVLDRPLEGERSTGARPPAEETAPSA
ncbi:ribbon-helix-helix domain-containing protein [Clavibacter nebraskensis]|uniref:ribbon-helix-helix domain-containing protein n=1 Tax=Clavibacter nebraskensis TaxID=31963 RepID=UPI003F4BA8FA